MANIINHGISSNGGLIPPGGIILWSGSTIPKGWALCNGGNGTPDLRNRFIVGSGDKYSIGNTGGSDSIALTSSQMPIHSHSGSATVAGDHTHTMFGYDNSGYQSAKNCFDSSVMYGKTTDDLATTSAGGHSHSLTINNAGGGAAHENRPPYYALAYIMKL